MRYVIYGAGAVGGTIGGRLFEHGHDVVLIARGDHLEAMRRHGLRLLKPEGEVLLPVCAVASPSDAGVGEGDVVILATKTQQSAAALDALAQATSSDVPVACAQNGVENERLALRHFANVYGVCVNIPATHLLPGVVQSHGGPLSGILDLGRFPEGIDETARQIAADFDSSGFVSQVEPAIMRMKYRKLVVNLDNVLDALCVRNDVTRDLYRKARAEAYAVLEAAGIDVASTEEYRVRREGVVGIQEIEGVDRGGNSTWQSLARRATSIEADYLNGEIVLLGRLHSVPTPVNRMLQEMGGLYAREGVEPGSVAPEDLISRYPRS